MYCLLCYAHFGTTTTRCRGLFLCTLYIAKGCRNSEIKKHQSAKVLSFSRAVLCTGKAGLLQMDQLRQNGAFEDESIIEKRSIWVWLKENSGSFGDVPTKEKPGFWKWIYIGKAQLLIVSGLRQSRANEDEFRIEKRVCWGWINFGNDGLLRMNLSWKSGAFDCDLTRAKQMICKSQYYICCKWL